MSVSDRFEGRHTYTLRFNDPNKQGYVNAVNAIDSEKIAGPSGWVDTYLVLNDYGVVIAIVPAWMVAAEITKIEKE